jgi:hypothetical protein
MSETSALRATHPNSSSCWSRVIESKWSDVTLITGFIALLIIAIVASTGAFDAIGTTNAASLSYGMYGSAASFLIAECILALLRYKSNTQAHHSNTRSNVYDPLIGPLSPEEIELLKLCVSDFVNKSAYPNKEELKKTITDILDQPDFQNNPQIFMSIWKTKREPKSPLEKEAYNFFHKLVFDY